MRIPLAFLLLATVPLAATAIDGDPSTSWWPAGGTRAPRHPHLWTASFPRPVPIAVFVAMNRQNHCGHGGDIRRYRPEAAGTDADEGN